MEGSGPSMNLDSLIRNFSDDELGVLKISNETIQSAPVDDDPDSDSSYEKLAKVNADSMDQKILDEQMDFEMKAARIRAAKLIRQKEIEESQDKNKGYKSTSNPFKNNSRNSKNDRSKDKGRPTSKSHSSKNENFKDASQPIDGSSQCKNSSKLNDRSLKNNNAQKLDKKFKKNVSNKSKVDKANKTDIEKINDIGSKMKNVTIQNFDIVSSSTSCSEDETKMDLNRYSQVLDGYQKSFTVRSLNRKEEVISSSDEDQEEGSAQNTILLPRFQSAEKSAASQRRKRSNYLKKRHSNFKKDAGAKDSDQSNPKPSLNIQATVKKPESSHRKLDKITEKVDENHSDDSIKVKKVIILKQTKPSGNSGVKNNDKPTRKTPRKQLEEKRNEHFNDTSQKDKNVHKNYTKNKDSVKTQKDKHNDVKFPRYKNGLICKSDKSNVNNDNIPNLSKDPRTSNSKTPKNSCPGFDNSNVGQCSSSVDKNYALDNLAVSKEESEDDEVPRILLRLDLSQPSMDNDIDWEATDAINAAKISNADFAFESDEEINFTSLVRNVSELKKRVPTRKNNVMVEHDGSSSDLDAEFDATLVRFNLNK